MTTEEIKDLALEGLRAIVTLIGGSAGKGIADVLTAVGVIGDSVIKAVEGKPEFTPERVREEIAKLVTGIEQMKRTDDEALGRIAEREHAARTFPEESTDPDPDKP